jgi:thymidylate synthase (FAD)
MKVELMNITPDPEYFTVLIARVSSNREDKSEDPIPLINYLIKNNHWSPFEHAFMTVKIETSRAIGTQILRHRSFTFQELSQRYKDLSKADIIDMFDTVELREKGSSNRQGSLEVFDPDMDVMNVLDGVSFDYEGYITDVNPASELVNQFLGLSLNLYKELINKGVAPECARMILPLCTKTTIHMTGSIRSWIHFLAQRMDLHAQKEIRLIAYEIWSIFKEQFPIISKALLTDESKIWNQYETGREEREQGR